jgi:PAS domain S-box-containing protein
MTEIKRLERDIADLKAYLEGIIQATASGLFTVDRDLRITEWNPAAELITGYKREEVIGRRCIFKGTSQCRACELFRIKEPILGREYELTTKDGRKKILRKNAAPLRDAKGNIIGGVESFTDITQRKEFEKMKEELIANVTHELRTPITICKGAIELAMRENDRENRRKILSIALSAMNRQNHIVGNLMTSAQLDKGKLKLKIATMDLKPLLLMPLREITPIAVKKGIKIETSIPEGLPQVRADREKIKHAVYNLLENAVKFNRKGGKVFVKAGKRGREVVVCIGDTGIGIPRKDVDRIFNRFYQVDASMNRRYGGVGLGLAVARTIIELHGGRIWAASKKQRGSRFYFTLPIERQRF